MYDKNYTFLQLKDKNCKINAAFLYDITEHLKTEISKCDYSEELRPYL
jgi:hypothetical protein